MTTTTPEWVQTARHCARHPVTCPHAAGSTTAPATTTGRHRRRRARRHTLSRRWRSPSCRRPYHGSHVTRCETAVRRCASCCWWRGSGVAVAAAGCHHGHRTLSRHPRRYARHRCGCSGCVTRCATAVPRCVSCCWWRGSGAAAVGVHCRVQRQRRLWQCYRRQCGGRVASCLQTARRRRCCDCLATRPDRRGRRRHCHWHCHRHYYYHDHVAAVRGT